MHRGGLQQQAAELAQRLRARHAHRGRCRRIAQNLHMNKLKYLADMLGSWLMKDMGHKLHLPGKSHLKRLLLTAQWHA